MDLLEIVQEMHREAKLPGSPPSTVAGQTGRAADLVAWAIDAWNDIQRDRDGRWKWLRSQFTVNTVAADGSYEYSDCTDVEDAAVITRFRAWHLDRDEPPLIYLTADGQDTERELSIMDWRDFRFTYVRAASAVTDAYPSDISVDVDDNLRLGPAPDAIYTVTGDYWKSNQTLADDDDEPEMPADYHKLIVYRGIIKYGYNAVAQEIIARCRLDGEPLYNELVNNQAWSRFSLMTAGALA